jgi:hypothetical protein
VAVIAHWACPEHPDQANTYYSMDAVGWRCNVCDEEAVRVDVVPAEQLRGAVEENERMREALEAIRLLWLRPAPAQRQDVAFQQAVRIASIALGAWEDVEGGEDTAARRGGQ